MRDKCTSHYTTQVPIFEQRKVYLRKDQQVWKAMFQQKTKITFSNAVQFKNKWFSFFNSKGVMAPIFLNSFVTVARLAKIKPHPCVAYLAKIKPHPCVVHLARIKPFPCVAHLARIKPHTGILSISLFRHLLESKFAVFFSLYLIVAIVFLTVPDNNYFFTLLNSGLIHRKIILSKFTSKLSC